MTLNTQTQANNDNASYDARRFGCAPWGAARGIAFRRFKRGTVADNYCMAVWGGGADG